MAKMFSAAETLDLLLESSKDEGDRPDWDSEESFDQVSETESSPSVTK